MPVDFFLKQTNRLALLEFDVTNDDGTAVDLTGATSVTYAIWSATPGTDALNTLNATVTVDPASPHNHVTVSWASGDTDVAGRYYGRCDIVMSSGRHLTVPNVGYHQILIDERGPTA